MAGLSTPGIGSGLDVNGLVSKLMSIEQQPLTALATKEADLQAKITTYGSIKSALATLQSAASALASTSTFSSVSAAVSDSSVLSVTTSSSATTGTYDINVTQLAKNQALTSVNGYGSSDVFNPGLLAITVGGNTTNVTITAGVNDTLSGIAQSINTAKAGVTATVINTGTTNRLILTATGGGTAGSMTIAAAEGAGSGTQHITDFIYSGTDTATVTQTQAPLDAHFTINNIPITRSDNTVTDAIPGVTLTLTKESSATVTLGPNPSTAVAAVNTFVTAYNAAATLLRSSSAYNATTGTSSMLTGDATVRSLESQMNTLMSSTVSGIGGGISSLADVGIAAQKDGTLTVNTAKLVAALNNPNLDVAGLFTQTTTGNTGLAVRFKSILDNQLGSTGLIASRLDGINTTIKRIESQRTAISQRLVNVEALYRQQFTTLDTLLSSMSTTSSYLSQQISAIQATTNGINSGK